MVHGPWSGDHGPWTMVHGPWSRCCLAKRRRKSQSFFFVRGILANKLQQPQVVKVWGRTCFKSIRFVGRDWSMDHGPWTMLHGPWSMDHGPSTILLRPGPMDHCLQTTVHGPWSMDHGPWAMVHGPWTVDHGFFGCASVKALHSDPNGNADLT